MADPLSRQDLLQILNALTSVDHRLSRIEANLNIRIATGVGVPLQAVPLQAVAPTPIAPPPPPPSQQAPQQQPQQQQQQQQHQPVAHAPHTHPAPPPTPVLSNNNNINNNAAATGFVGAVPYRALEPPPQGYTISSRATMQEELDAWTIPRGYSMRIAGAKVTGKKKVRWVCFRGGEARHHRAPVEESVILAAKAEGRRKPTTDRASKKCGCMFKFEVIETVKGSDVWTLHYPNDMHKVHNHPPSDQTSDPRARKLPPYMLNQVDQWLAQGWQVAKIQDELRTRGFTNVLNTDLYNRKRLLKKDVPQVGAAG